MTEKARFRVKARHHGQGQWIPVDAESFEAAAVDAWVADRGIRAGDTVTVSDGSEERRVVVKPTRAEAATQWASQARYRGEECQGCGRTVDRDGPLTSGPGSHADMNIGPLCSACLELAAYRELVDHSDQPEVKRRLDRMPKAQRDRLDRFIENGPTRPNFPQGGTDALSVVDWRSIKDFPGGPVGYLRHIGYSAKDAVAALARRVHGNPPPPEWLGPISRCGKCESVTTLRACPCGGRLRALTEAEADAYVERGHAAFKATMPRRASPRDNPALILVHAINPRPPAEVERAWCKFHEKDDFTGTVRNVGRIAGAPDYTFALGRCVDVDLGRGYQPFTPRPWLVFDPKDEALWIIAEAPMRLGSGVAGTEVRAVTYDPMASSGKEPSKYRHRFEAPLPTFAPVGNPNYCRAVMFDGGGYVVDSWIRD